MIEFNREDYADVIETYKDDAMTYCLDVLEGRLLAGELIQYACLRHLNDLKRIDSDESFPYIYSTKRANGMIKFASLVPDVSSDKILPLPEFQKFIYSMIQGWINPKVQGLRFKTIYLSMARTNGKTQMASVLALRDFLMGQPVASRQIVEASNTNEQIKQLYNYTRKAWHALSRSQLFKSFSNEVIDNSQEMRIDSQNTRLMRMSSEGTTGDSVHASTTIFDEYHLQKTTDYIDSFSSGNVQNPLAKLIIISTAGTDPRCPMREDYSTYSEAIAQNKLDDSILFLCWEQDKNEEAFDEETWIKSNPLMEIESMRAKLTAGIVTERNKQVSAGNLPRFLVMNMNRWQNAKKNAYIPLELLNKAVSDEPFNFDGRDVYIGYDASLANDDTSLVFVFPYQTKLGVNRFYVYQHTWVPTRQAGGLEAKMKADGINYEQAEAEGYATVTQNRFGTVNQDEIYHWMLDFIEKHQLKVRAIGYDSWGTGSFIRAVEDHKDDWLLFPIRQGAKSLSEPTKFLQDAFNEGIITIPDDRVLKAGLSNAVLTSKDNQLLIDKNVNSAKIDMVDALIDALYQGMLHFTSWTQEKIDDKGPFVGMSNEQINDYFHNDFSF